MKLYKLVQDALDNAINENTYQSLLSRSTAEVAEDLREYCSDFENVPLPLLQECVRVYMNERKKR